jgi:NADH:ubiquinone oxidoreductase subunit E
MSLDYNTIKYMNLFTPEALANEFMEQYQYEFGQKKVIEIVRKIEDSDKVNDYLNSILSDRIKPSAKGLETLMNTISYFMFSKEETLCLGGLATFIIWRNRFMVNEDIFDALEQEKIDHLLTPICSELINNCSINKYNKSDNFFLRFQKRIFKIAREEGMTN